MFTPTGLSRLPRNVGRLLPRGSPVWLETLESLFYFAYYSTPTGRKSLEQLKNWMRTHVQRRSLHHKAGLVLRAFEEFLAGSVAALTHALTAHAGGRVRHLRDVIVFRQPQRALVVREG